MKKLIISILLLTIQQAVVAASFKCWTNSDGVRECGNSIPPQYSNQRIQFHNSKSGNVNKVKEASKSREQIRQEKETERIRQIEERKVAKQNAYDDVLLKTYLTIDDLLLSLDWKITTLDSQIKIASGTISGLEQQFIELSTRAAQSERAGGTIPDNVQTELDAIRHKVSLQKNHIKKLENDKKSIHTKFKHDAERFTISTINALALSMDEIDNPKTKFMSQIKCTTNSHCKRAWISAKQFVDSNSSLPIIFNTDVIYTNESPAKASDYALTVSQVKHGYNTSTEKLITLEVRCHHSPEGEKACQQGRVQKILKQFKKH